MLYASEGGKLACQTLLAFAKTSLLKMLFVALSALFLKAVLYLNTVSVNFTKNLVYVARKNLRRLESVSKQRGCKEICH
ncbi:hypothetical protein GZ22_09455 [Terribacillus saccharophilus]|uniref:Uncharacterized protein n=1 Tax=Terribacillus saccharophilus TaxID=361277 RepID=A0A075LJC8_9BACI|nr:hypothetical protein GZ22_09455 [Terribacillus goriensis]